MTRYIRILSIFFLLTPIIVSAQNNPTINGLNNAAQGTGLIQKSAPEVIAGLIRVALTLMGTIFTVLVLLGGFRWMTSAGNPEKIKEAKSMIINASIGLLVVLVSYAVVRFVLDAILDINQGGGGGVGDGEG